MDELSIIDRFFRPLAGEGAFRLFDDAAKLAVPPDCDLVVTTDMVAAGVHFLSDDPPDTIAQKALRVNLSDLAAKGARPLAFVMSIALPADVDAAWLGAFADGMRRDQAAFRVDLLGGDTIFVEHGPLVSITAFGAAPGGGMVHRSGGRPGDLLYVSGTIGAATAGLALLKGREGPWDGLSTAERAALVARYRVPEPRVALAPALVEFASAAMDVSDGLIGDCDKLAEASGCAALIEAERVPLPVGLAPAACDAVSARDEAAIADFLTGGDDYEILAAVPPGKEAAFTDAARRAGVPVARVGMLREGGGAAEVSFRGQALRLGRRAYVHGQAGEA